MTGRRLGSILLFMTLLFSKVLSIPEANASTSLSLEPNRITILCLDLEDAATVVFLQLTVFDILDLKEFSFTFIYNTSILAPCPPHDSFGMIDTSFYLTAGGWTGSSLMGRLAGTFSGSGTMFTYGFKVLNPGTTSLNLTDVILRDSNGSIIPHTVTGCTVEVVSFEEWVNGEYADLLEQYSSLNATYSRLQTDYLVITADQLDLLSAYTHLQETYAALNASYSSLQADYTELEGNYTQLSEDNASLTTTYQNLESEYASIVSDLHTVQNLMYFFIATSIILLLAVMYLAKRKQPLTWK